MSLHVQSAISSSFIKQRCEWCRQKKKIPISLGLTVSCEVSRRSKEDLNADATKNEGRDEVLDCALFNQGVNDASQQVHMSPSRSVMLSDCERVLICFF